ncbi:MAG: amidohydrolase [Acidimicrobiia bacterium]|nr:amidohydrolase [Acidimicrobiia bacterium]
MSHYTIVSADGHAGADMATYRSYLPGSLHDEFDQWAAAYLNPFNDLERPGRERNWESSLRARELEADGIVAEVLFPNTVPPFFPSSNLTAYPPRTTSELEQRSEGLAAHNRWLADFCAELPGRRAGLAQLFVNDIDQAVATVEWAAGAGLPGILMPAVPPDCGLAPLWSDRYDPIWAACQHHDLTVTQHGGTGLPDITEAPCRNILMIMEVPFFSNRNLWHLILSGVFERFGDLRFVMTEQRVDWVTPTLRRMDTFWERMNAGGVGEMVPDETMIPQRPSHYFRRNVWMGSSFPSVSEAQAIAELGSDRVMWGGDYPHIEGTFPHSREAIRQGFCDWDEAVLHRLLGATAAQLYRFDLDWLRSLDIGPSIDEIAEPLDQVPADTTSLAFRPV